VRRPVRALVWQRGAHLKCPKLHAGRVLLQGGGARVAGRRRVVGKEGARRGTGRAHFGVAPAGRISRPRAFLAPAWHRPGAFLAPAGGAGTHNAGCVHRIVITLLPVSFSRSF